MTPQCTHSLSNGNPCNAPAVNGSKFCRHHDPQRPLRPVQEEPRDNEHLVLPLMEDPWAVLIALNEVIHALAEGRIKHSVAATLLSGIKLVSRLVNQLIEKGLLKPEEPETLGAEELPAIPEVQSTAWQPTGQVASSMASPSGSNKAVRLFSASHPHSAESEMDSTTEYLIRELVAQSHELTANHVPRT